jgi:hypothetical protein
VARDHYSPPKTTDLGRQPDEKARWARRVLLFAGAAIVLAITAWIVRETWRSHTLLAFCKAARPGMSFGDLIKLEKRHWIDESYLVQARFEGYQGQRDTPGLEFRSQMFDPDFACAITHDGVTVKFVQLLTLEGFGAS